MNLTKRQSELLAFIKAFQRKNKYSPSMDEMTKALGVKAKSAAHRAVHQLVDRGFLAAPEGKARNYRVLTRLDRAHRK